MPGRPMNDSIPKPHHTVNEVMSRWPQTVWLFMRYGMACAGCPVGAFHTVEEAALEYRILLPALLAELRDAACKNQGRRVAKRKSPAGEGRRAARH